jgi:2-polyprenyl-3-methyl-5-hydroxy-6-metoxy-1,4-benzoquinol methylase
MSSSPPLAADEARRLYSDAYYSGDEAARFKLSLAERLMRAFRRRRARALARELGGAAGKRILDVGCGRGFTLHELQRQGADVYGTQMSAAAVGVAEALIGGGRVFLGELSDARYAPGSFDCVTLWHVLEHVPRPADVLIEVARILKSGGLAYIEVPNAGGWTARRFGADWLAWDVDHHVSHFTPATLNALAERAGLSSVREVHLSLEYSPATLTQTWLNRLFGGHNRLFRALTFGGRMEADERGPVPLPVHAAAALVLFPAAVASSMWLAARRCGDTVGIYFRKPL